jgi:virginiamycin B lyase
VLALAATLTVIACACFAAQADAFIYWTDQAHGTIGRANLDGSDVNDSFVTGAGTPFGVAVDGQYIYWADETGGTIGRVNVDGSDANDSFITGANHPYGVAVNGQYIYWGNTGTSTIGRANLDGSSPDASFITGAGDPLALAVDGQYVYWADDNNDTIGRANLDGSSPEDNFITGLAGPAGVAVNGQHVYWSTTVMGFGTIGQANLADGLDHENIFFANPSARLWGVAVDSQYFYWANIDAGTIGRENLDLNPITQSASFITVPAELTGVAVDALPLAPAASIAAPVNGTTFTFGQVVDSSFTCSEGKGGSGISSCLDQNGQGPGAAIDTTTPGTHTITVTATSADGQKSTASSTYTVLAAPLLPPPAVAPPAVAAPVLGALKGSHASWREGNAPARISSDNKLARQPVGTTFTFTLNVPATVKLAFTTRSPGRLSKIKGKRVCVAQTKHNTKLPKCTRTLTAGTMSLKAHTGTDKIAFQGRTSPTRKLKPGTYTVTFTAIDATASSKPRSVKFAIVK